VGHTVPAASEGTDRSVAKELRAMAMTWAMAAMLPLPILVATDPAATGDISCLYLGLACGWLVAEFNRCGGLPQSRPAWRARTLAIVLAVATNVILFVAFGVAGGVQTSFPFPLMATLSAIPAIGMIPWLMRCVRHPYASILLGGVLVLVAKLAACVVARIVYGPDYIAQGYVSADWHSAKLMISLFWSFSTLASLGCFVANYRDIRRPRPTLVVTLHTQPAASATSGAA
jgi:hypothetical protein